jgi:hypothetical protein
MWLEVARLHVRRFLLRFGVLSHVDFLWQNNDDVKVILANAVQHIGQSVKIWLAAADFECDVKAKKVCPTKRWISALLIWHCDVLLTYVPTAAEAVVERG